MTDTMTSVDVGLSREAYVSADVLRRELTDFFSTTWQYAGHVSEFATPGAFKRFQLGDADIVVIRGSDGELRALHNTCRHRGAQLIDRPDGVCGRSINCSYHGWAYDTTGALRGAPHMGNTIDRATLGLRQARLEVWDGVVFVNVDGHAPVSVRDTLTDVSWPANDVARSKVAKVVSFDVHTNWKASWENALECYHCAINHPELIQLLDRDSGPREVQVGTDYSYGGNPLRAGNTSVTMSGQVESAVVYDLRTSLEDARGFLQWHRAAFEMIFSPEHIAIMTYLPLGTDSTRITQTFLVPEAATPGVDFDPESLFAMHTLTREQDNLLCEKIQAGVRNPAYTPGPFNESYERENRRFLGTYRAVMGDL